MNIFYLDKNPVISAQMHNDKHVVKMIVEYAQMLSTAHRVLDGQMYYDPNKTRKIKRWLLQNNTLENKLYKATHMNHPSAKWVRESVNNYNWLYKSFVALCLEYTHRYGKIHKTDSVLRNLLSTPPKNIPQTKMTDIPQAMPDYCKDNDSITAYRSYYILEKSKFNNYTNREKPFWL